MGAWGAGIFSDDLALDIRGEWRDGVLAGEDAPAITARLAARYDDGEPVFWLALAAAQMETGRLDEAVRDRALELIEAGADLELWEETGGRAAREKVLQRLAAKLRGPQPKPKKLRGSRRGPDPGVAAGDVVRLWSADRRRSALFAVLAVHQVQTWNWPALLGLYWTGGEIPPLEELARLPYLSAVDLSAFTSEHPPPYMPIAGPHAITVMVSRKGEELRPEIGEVVARGVERPERDRFADPHSLTSWEEVAAMFEHGGGFDTFLEATRRRLERYGDDPRAWEREHAEMFAPDGPFAQALGPMPSWLREYLETEDED